MTFEFENVHEETIYTNQGMPWGSEWVGKVKVNGINFKFSIHNDSGTGRLSEKDGFIHNPDSFFDNNEITFHPNESCGGNPKLAIKDAFEHNKDVKVYFEKAFAEKVKKMSVKLFDNVMKDSMNLD